MTTTFTQPNTNEVGLLPAATTALWLGCLTIGIAGLYLPYPWPHLTPVQPDPIQAQIMHVDLTPETVPPPDVGPPSPTPDLSSLLQPPAPPPTLSAPPSPPLLAVATPSPAIAFPLPIEGPTQIIDAKQAVLSPSAKIATAPSPPQIVAAAPRTPEHLTYGQGEGRQPAPQYPREAALAHQQGTILVRFTVAEDGRVQSAQAISPCPYPLLNQSALRAIRETWRFPPGPPRSYEVSIEFQLHQH